MPEASQEKKKPLSPAAQRALREAKQRYEQQKSQHSLRMKEVGGRKGPDPVRYGDWEKKGIACDF